MVRSLTSGGVLFALGLAFGACSEGDSSGGFASVGPSYAGCGHYTSCASCTPVTGCGWCYLPDGTGKCVDDPNDCASSSAFSWTWDLKGCHVGADAAVTAVDAGRGGGDATAESSALEAATFDAPSPG
jgi:hypothetical protein